jgi:hypothetical protein
MMNTEKQTGQLIGALLFIAMLLGLWNNFVLNTPIFSGVGWLQNGAQMPLLFTAGALLGLLTSALMLVVAILAWPILRLSSPSLALAYLILSGIVFATTAMEQANFLAMRSLSLQFAKHPGLDPVMFELLRSMVGASRQWIHFIDKLIGGGSIFVMCLALYRSNLVPRIIAVCGMLAAPIQMCGISMVLFMQDMPSLMLAPIALSLLALSLSLLYRGFAVPGYQARYART